MLSLSQSLLSIVSVWTAKQFENDNADGEHICFCNKNSLFKFIWISVNVALVSFSIQAGGRGGCIPSSLHLTFTLQIKLLTIAILYGKTDLCTSKMELWMNVNAVWRTFGGKYFISRIRSRRNNNDNSHHVLGVLHSLFCPQKHSGLVVDGSLNKENPTERKHHG